ncbi:MAG: ribosomal protein S18-alanine N-acetyltransferase [Bacillota bacterium]|nr:ribosomal protein S18-alanine N-acetyltransferase [Bacillota bacterium]
MKVRKYMAKDFSCLYEIEKSSFSDCWSSEGMKDELSQSYANYFVAEEDNKIIGFGGFYFFIDESEIVRIAVHKDNRGRGCGRAILIAMVDEAKSLGAKNIFLEVRESNVVARKLYESMGFISYNIREKYYEGIEDAVLYRRKL